MILEDALAAHRAGINVLLPAEDGSKSPALKPWKHFQTERVSEEQVRAWCSNGATGLGVVPGAVSGNLEMLEFDEYTVYEEFMIAAPQVGLGELVERIQKGYAEMTPGDGVHWFYRCADGVGGNTKLARRPKRPEEMEHPNDNVKALIETRGEGGFAITAPSHGKVHPTGNPYVRFHGGFATIAEISGDERRALHEFAATFDRMPKSERTTTTKSADAGRWKVRPGDDFVARTSWSEQLEPHGWQRLFTTAAGNEHWRRPGKNLGTSATISDSGKGVLYVFSSSTPLEPGRGYSKFSAYVILVHNGDADAAVKQLIADGYGVPDDDDDCPQPATRKFKCTDMGNAERLVARFGDDLRYCHELGKWLTWTRSRWREDTGDVAVTRMAKRTVRGIYDEAKRANKSRALGKWAAQSEAEIRIRAMLRLARSEEGIPVEPGDLDADPMLLNVTNGTIELRTGELRPHRREDLCTKMAPVAYDPKATCPAWLAFLEHVLPDRDVRLFIQELVGYSLTGLTSEQILAFLYGGGANGKTTLLQILLALLGDYGRQAEPELLMARREAHPTGVADLRGARLVVSTEIEEGRRLAESTVKQLTGGDRLKARYMRQDFFEFEATHQIYLAANHRPEVRGTDHAIWRRIRLIPFTVTIPLAEQDKQLVDRLRAELPGILAWAIEGCLRWRKDGLSEPSAVRLATGDYRKDMDVVGAFLSDCCVEGADKIAPASKLYPCYQDWCTANGEDALSQRALGRVLTERGFERHKYGKKRHWHWFGVGLVDPEVTP